MIVQTRTETKPRLQMSWKLWAEVWRVLTNLQTLTTDSTRNCLHGATASPHSADPWYDLAVDSFLDRTCHSADSEYVATTNNTFLVLNGQRLRDLYAYSTSQIQYTETKLRNSAEAHPSFKNVFFKNWIHTKNREYSTKSFWVTHRSDQPGIVIKIHVLGPGLRV